nr:RNB domain-containing ribonuclease [Flaviflexus huanghaiensis]
MAGLRDRLGIAVDYPAEAVADIRPVDITTLPDHRDIPFVTIDPPDAGDLDQALHLSRTKAGYLVRYAISAVGLFIEPGSVLDREVHARGVTLYGPDGSVPLHPTELAAGVASLLEGEDRPAYLWHLYLDSAGGLLESSVELAQVRSRARLTYDQVQQAYEGRGKLPRQVPTDLTDLLSQVGMLRIEREIARGGVSLDLPEQLIEATNGGFQLTYRGITDVDEWNAQISLLTGMAAARMMKEANIGILRTLPPAREKDYVRLRQVATALDLEWPHDVDYATFVRSLNSSDAGQAAFLNAAAGLFRGASYLALPPSKKANGDDVEPEQSSQEKQSLDDRSDDRSGHAAIASIYSHVTAPLRRLVDRYALETCRCICAGEPIPEWVTNALPQLPKTMARANQRAATYERGAVDALESLILSGREGEIFDGVVIDTDSNGEPIGIVMLREPAVEAKIHGEDLPVGKDIRVRLVNVGPEGSQFHPVEDEK